MPPRQQTHGLKDGEGGWEGCMARRCAAVPERANCCSNVVVAVLGNSAMDSSAVGGALDPAEAWWRRREIREGKCPVSAFGGLFSTSYFV